MRRQSSCNKERKFIKEDAEMALCPIAPYFSATIGKMIWI